MDQFVIAYLPALSPSTVSKPVANVLTHAVNMAKILNKGLILLHVVDKRYKPIMSVDDAGAELKRLVMLLKQGEGNDIPVAPYQDVSHCAMAGDTREIMNRLPKLLGAVLVVAAADKSASLFSPLNPSQVLRNFRDSRIAYLTVQSACAYGGKSATPSVAFTVDYRRESKEKLVWASYYARFGGYKVQVLSENYKDEGLKHSWYENVRFLNKIYDDLHISYTQHFYKASGFFPEMAAVEYASVQNFDVIVCSATDVRDIDVLEWIVGTADQRIIRNKFLLPVLFLNPRNDLYVLCD